MRDLENDFGFRIGPGNQAYMFDTLPKTINNINDVKPGDLVFISGIYYNSKSNKFILPRGYRFFKLLPFLISLFLNEILIKAH